MRSRMSCPEQAIVAAALKCETRAKTDIKLRPPNTARVLLRAIRGESARYTTTICTGGHIKTPFTRPEIKEQSGTRPAGDKRRRTHN